MTMEVIKAEIIDWFERHGGTDGLSISCDIEEEWFVIGLPKAKVIDWPQNDKLREGDLIFLRLMLELRGFDFVPATGEVYTAKNVYEDIFF